MSSSLIWPIQCIQDTDQPGRRRKKTPCIHSFFWHFFFIATTLSTSACTPQYFTVTAKQAVHHTREAATIAVFCNRQVLFWNSSCLTSCPVAASISRNRSSRDRTRRAAFALLMEFRKGRTYFRRPPSSILKRKNQLLSTSFVFPPVI